MIALTIVGAMVCVAILLIKLDSRDTPSPSAIFHSDDTFLSDERKNSSFAQTKNLSISERSLSNQNTQSIEQQLRSINIPLLDFEDSNVAEAIDFLRSRTLEEDESIPQEKGVSMIIRKSRFLAEGADLESSMEQILSIDPVDLERGVSNS